MFRINVKRDNGANIQHSERVLQQSQYCWRYEWFKTMGAGHMAYQSA
jgi:hypothetical protein